MTLRYEDALQEVLQALRGGEPLEAAIARFPEHTAALREEAQVAIRVAALSSAAPAAQREARSEALKRMQAEVSARRSRAAMPGPALQGFGWPRFAIAAALLAIAALGVGLMLTGGESTVEAATIEGVVVENEGDTITVQTLQALEEVEVPAGAVVSDVEGASIGLSGIRVGEVVVIDLERRDREAIARRVQRNVDSIEAWCAGAPGRCAALSAGLEVTQHRCEQAECPIAPDRVEELRLRAGDSITLEDLRNACRDATSGACERLVTFCREHDSVCGRLAPPDLPNADSGEPGERLRLLKSSCLQGNETACRQLARACSVFPGLCPFDPPREDGPGSPEAGSTPQVDRPETPRP